MPPEVQFTEAELDTFERQQDGWPEPPDRVAYHGVIGDMVRTIEPASEADPMAILIQGLLAFGSCVGHGPFKRVEATDHHLNLFAVLVGDTSKGRKGTALGQVMNVFRRVDESWATNCIQSGLSSGEGLIAAVHDPIEKHEPIRENGRVVDYQDVIVDPGIDDKRLLVVESEFASTLKVMSREGNTLSPLIRNAWDGSQLRTMTKTPMKATGHHISIAGHITRDELLRYLNSTESGNGFANRFLWACVTRSKFLPERGSVDEDELHDIVDILRESVEFARKVGSVEWSEPARQQWHEVYRDLSTGHAGLLGAVTSRATPQVTRLATIYALLDECEDIRDHHLEAALAVWEYSEQSARYIFGNESGDPTADEILVGLKQNPDGLTRTQINNHFKRHKAAQRIGVALTDLLKRKLVRYEEEATEGRRATRWFAVTKGPKKERTPL